MTRLLGLKFTKLALEHKSILSEVLINNQKSISGFTISSLLSFSDAYSYYWCFLDDNTLLFACLSEEDREIQLLSPVGEFSINTQRNLLDILNSFNKNICFFAIDACFLCKNEDFVNHFIVKEDRVLADYIYLSYNLAYLPGRSLQKKRNLLSQARNNYQWISEDITLDNIKDCWYILNRFEEQQKDKKEISVRDDTNAIRFSLTNFRDLYHSGVLVIVNGEPAAFSLFEKQNEDTAVVHFERALTKYKGIYQVINMETAKRIFDKGFTYINREDDAGDEGLRQAKMSYHPYEIRMAYLLCYQKRDLDLENSL